VAGAVGLIMARIFDLQDDRGEEAAVCLGVAMQLTNICRDVGEDLSKGRIYLPQSELREFGVSEEDLLAGRVTPEYQNLMAFQLDRARSYYARAEEGIPLLGSPSGRLCVRLMRFVYAGIHGRIERARYDNLHRRVSTSLLEKMALTVRAIGHALHPRPLDPEFFRHSGVELSHAP
jgi:phytoene synthase